MTDFIELFQYTFFQNALLGSLFASIACGIIGTYIVTRRLVFISGGITHASFGGIGIGLYTGISPLLKTPPLPYSGHSAWRWELSSVFSLRDLRLNFLHSFLEIF